MSRRTTHRLLACSLLFGLLPALSIPAGAAPLQDWDQDASPAPATAGQAEYAYGPDPLQKLDVWRARRADPAPLVVFVHGGGWKRGDKRSATGIDMVEHLTGEGYALASIDYRLVPAATVEQQAADVAQAVAWLRRNAARLHIDATRIVLMGHSAGAHLVALVGTDPRYLAAAGLALSDLRGVIALDGACYDVPQQMAEHNRFMQATYLQTFGRDPRRQRALSPTFQAAAPNAPAFLLAHVDRDESRTQAEALAAALARAGTPVEVDGFPGTGLRGHMDINRSLGRPDAPATAVVDAWLRRYL